MSGGAITIPFKSNKVVLNLGSGNFTVPDGVEKLFVRGIGGGGGGTSGSDPASCGGNGGEFYDIIVDVTPGQVIPWVCGQGGAQGIYPTHINGYDGNDTTFGSITWNGGAGGDYILGVTAGNPVLNPKIGRNGGFQAASWSNHNGTTDVQDGESTIFGSGGSGGDTGAGPFASGNGGGAGFGNGGEGEHSDRTTAATGGGVGAGGGGGTYGGGGTGGDGQIIIWY